MPLEFSQLLSRNWRTLIGGDRGPYIALTPVTIQGNKQRQSLCFFSSGDFFLTIQGQIIRWGSSSTGNTNQVVLDRYTYGDLIDQPIDFSSSSADTLVGETYINENRSE